MHMRHWLLVRLQKTPLSLALCAYWCISFAIVMSIPEAVSFLVLSPERVLDHRELWRVLTYSAFPISAGSLVFLAAESLWFGWYLEPGMRSWRYLSIYFAPALIIGIIFTLATDRDSLPLAGAYLTASSVLAVFTAWSMVRARDMPRLVRLLWLVSAWVLYSTLSAPLGVLIMHLIAWCVALFVAFPALRPLPTNTRMERTRASRG